MTLPCSASERSNPAPPQPSTGPQTPSAHLLLRADAGGVCVCDMLALLTGFNAPWCGNPGEGLGLRSSRVGLAGLSIPVDLPGITVSITDEGLT